MSTAVKSLHITDDTFTLPLDSVTSTFAILAKKRAGKSNAAVVMAEEMYACGVQWVALDPKGDWYGVRSGGDGGTVGGMDIPIFGGRHGDIPLSPDAGVLMADIIIDDGLTCVLDVSEFSKAEVTRFLTAFGDRLYRRAENHPMHLFMEEAHEYLPQRVGHDETKLVNVMQRIVKMGGFKGIGVTLITQRSAALNKDVLTQTDTMVAMRTTSPQDRAAVKAWVDVHAASAEMMDTLPSLGDGEAWVWSPELLGVLQRIQFRRRATFDSGATPKVGAAPMAAPALRDIDLEGIRTAMVDIVAKTAAEDPKLLRRRIHELEAEVRAADSTLMRARAETAAAVQDHEAILARVRAEARDPKLDINLAENLNTVLVELDRIRRIVTELLQGAELRMDPTGATSTSVEWAPDLTVRGSQRVANPGFRVPATAIASDRAQTPPAPERREPRQNGAPHPRRLVEGDATLSKAERALLNVLLQFGDGRTRVQLALLSKYSHKSSTFANALGALRTKGYVDKGDPIKHTEAAIGLINVEPLATGPELLTYWLGTLDKAQGILLRVMLDVWPQSIDRDVLAERSGYSAGSSTFANALGRLRSFDLVKGLTVSDWFAEEVRA